MTRTSINNKTYELDVDQVRSVPHCTKIQKQTTDHERCLYSTPYQTEPVYESPLTLAIEWNTATNESNETTKRHRGRCKANDIYETTDSTLPHEQGFTGYTYVANSENVVPVAPRSSQPSFAYDNLGHEYEESFRKSRFSKNVVYDHLNSSGTLTLEGIRDTKTGSSKRHSPHEIKSSGKKRAGVVQIFTLLLSLLASLIAILALLVASGKVKLNGKVLRRVPFL